jgi:MtN3 and saliva related transmembrane protein
MVGPAPALLDGPDMASERGTDRSSATPMRRSLVIDALAVAAASWGVLMALSPILQVRRMVARRSSADVSLAYLGVLQVGFTLWVGYGLSIGNMALVVPNSVAFLIGVATLGIAYRFRNPDRVAADAT